MELDVIVFESRERRLALELGYVHEVCSLGHVTPIPLAPEVIQGAANVRGKMVPVVTLEPLLGSTAPGRVLPGTLAILVEADGALAAVPVRRIVDVVTVPLSRYEEGGQGSGPLIPGTFRSESGSVSLLDVPGALRAVREATRLANQQLYTT
jgi:purine-binding chemotaxis protein CheW